MAVQEDQKNQVQQATDIVRLIGEQVALRPKGKEFVGLCPFHDDKNPSMFVSPVKQIYKCFSCGAGGDVFTFVTQYHKMTFPEGLKFLAERAGIKLERRSRGAGAGAEEGQSDRQRLAAVNAQAVGFFRALYRHAQHGRIAREYVQKRGISPEMVEAFQIGYAPDRWDGLVLTITEKKWDAAGFELAGLIKARGQGAEGPRGQVQEDRGQGAKGPRGQVTEEEKAADSAFPALHSAPRPLGPSAPFSPPSVPSNHYDRLRHRLIFPIFDAIGRPIAFGGRKLREEDEPKYLNSPETALFNKSATLYGLHLAKKPIIDSRTAVIVEGYTDVIACHQAGASNVVATLGTALTADHVRELRRYAEQVVLLFDGDTAGQKAADRAVELFLTSEVDVAIAVLPQGPDGRSQDPADLMAQPDGLAQWQATVAAAKDALTYQFERVREQVDQSDTITGRQRVAEAYLRQLGQLGLDKLGALRGALVQQRLAQLLNMSEAAISQLLHDFAPRTPRSNRSVPTPSSVESPGNPASPQFAISEGSETIEGSWADNVPADIASGESRHRLRAIQLAQRQLIGCLLRRNELFQHTLPDGRTLDEALTPAEFVTRAEQQLYEQLYARLSNGEPTSLAGLLGELAASGRTELATVATEAELMVERAVADREEQLKAMLGAAAQALLEHHESLNYRRRRAVVSDAGGDQKLQGAEDLRESLRERPSPVRIARPRP